MIHCLSAGQSNAVVSAGNGPHTVEPATLAVALCVAVTEVGLRLSRESDRFYPYHPNWAQVMYPFVTSTHEDMIKKLEYDLYYIKNISFALDLRIFIKTIKMIILGKGK